MAGEAPESQGGCPPGGTWQGSGALAFPQGEAPAVGFDSAAGFTMTRMISPLTPAFLSATRASVEVSKAVFEVLIFSITTSWGRPAWTIVTMSSLVSGSGAVAATPIAVPATTSSIRGTRNEQVTALHFIVEPSSIRAQHALLVRGASLPGSRKLHPANLPILSPKMYQSVA